METRKLYYEDSHLASFTARVLSCEKTEKGWEIALDATAFYPEGGGQAADTGTLDAVHVLHTRERQGQVLHLCDGPLEPGRGVRGTIDFSRRFGLMQQHSGEHMVSGIIHRRYGFHNTGFHVGSEIITIDFDGVIPAEDLPAIEAEANGAVWQDLPVKCWVPAPEVLATIPYRTKRALPWPVRIVEFPGMDICACCGTHVRRTGEIGLIKLFTAIPFRGGTRMEMACGRFALKLLNQAYDQNRQVSQAFSAKITETGEAARRMNETLARQKYRITGLERQLFRGIAERYGQCGDVVHFEEGMDSDALLELADTLAQVCGGVAAVFSGSDEEGYGYCLVTRKGDLRELGREMTHTLSGRGGGKPLFQRGRVMATKTAISAFFAAKK